VDLLPGIRWGAEEQALQEPPVLWPDPNQEAKQALEAESAVEASLPGEGE